MQTLKYLAATLLLGLQASAAPVTLDDPADDYYERVDVADRDARFDAIRLEIERQAADKLTFTFVTQQPLPAELPRQAISFRIYLDLDNNTKTGQNWSIVAKDIGADFEASILWHEGRWMVMPEHMASSASCAVEGNRASITITDKRFSGLTTFQMFGWVNGLKGNMDVLPNKGVYKVVLNPSKGREKGSVRRIDSECSSVRAKDYLNSSKPTQKTAPAA
jgi:hypothetical protein